MSYKNLNKIIFLNLLLILIFSCRNGETENDEITEDPYETNSEFEPREERQEIEIDLLRTINGKTELSRFAMELGAADIPELQIENEVYTIFAPENGIYNSRYGESDKKIREMNTANLLAYHIVKGNIDLEEIRKETESNNEWNLKSLNGEDLTLTRENNEFYLKGNSGERAKILKAYHATNGIVYVIDEILFPAGENE